MKSERGFYQSFKWMQGFNNGGINKDLIISGPGRTRSNGLKLEKFRFNKDR